MKNSGLKHIAQRYVKALFDFAVEQRVVDIVEKDMRALGSLLKQSSELRSIIASPLISQQQQADAMERLLDAMAAHSLVKGFVDLLARKKRLMILPEVIAFFAESAAHARGEMNAEMVAAGKVSHAEAALVSDLLGKMYGRKINLNIRQDEKLLGGMMVKIGSQQLDGSLAGKLQRLEQKLKVA